MELGEKQNASITEIAACVAALTRIVGCLGETVDTLAEILKAGLVHRLIENVDRDLRDTKRTDRIVSKEFSPENYWSLDLRNQVETVEADYSTHFDTVLQNNFREAAENGVNYDLSRIFDGTRVLQEPATAITYVEALDRQTMQAGFPIAAWFKPLAYVLILLRAEGHPYVFFGDYYGMTLRDPVTGQDSWTLPSHKAFLDALLRARADYGFGDQHDYFDQQTCIGWIRTGNAEHPGAMAVAISSAPWPTSKWMRAYKPEAWFYEATGRLPEIKTNRDGWGEFPCPAQGVAVWLTR